MEKGAVIKAGIIVGCFIIVVAIIIAVVVNGKDKNGDISPAQSQGNHIVETTPVQTSPVVTPTTPNNTTNTTKPTNSGTSGVVAIDESTLPAPVRTTELGYVQSKSVSLIDGSLYYTLQLLVGTDNISLMYVVSADGYTSVDVGAKLKISLASYTVSNGNTYYLVEGLSFVD